MTFLPTVIKLLSLIFTEFPFRIKEPLKFSFHIAWSSWFGALYQALLQTFCQEPGNTLEYVKILGTFPVIPKWRKRLRRQDKTSEFWGEKSQNPDFKSKNVNIPKATFTETGGAKTSGHDVVYYFDAPGKCCYHMTSRDNGKGGREGVDLFQRLLIG